MKIHSLHVGINNYPGSGSDLAGCVNDARNSAKRLRRRANTQHLVLDGKATRSMTFGSTQDILQDLRADDWLVLWLSSHGTFAPDTSGDELDGRDEGVVCADFRIIWDDEWKALFADRHPQSFVFAFFDCCHSGTMPRNFFNTAAGGILPKRPKYLPLAKFPARKRPLPRPSGVDRPSNSPLPGVVPMGACLDPQLASDAEFGGQAAGAATHYALQTLDELRPGATFGQWFKRLRSHLPCDDYNQTPTCNATRQMLDTPIPWL